MGDKIQLTYTMSYEAGRGRTLSGCGARLKAAQQRDILVCCDVAMRSGTAETSSAGAGPPRMGSQAVS